MKVDPENPADKWFYKAYNHTFENLNNLIDSTYEAIGPHFQGNPYGLEEDMMVMHGMGIVEVERTYLGVRKWLESHDEEGLVFWLNGEPVCKIKRSDIGLEWPIKGD